MPESSSTTGCAYRAFISYSHRDKPWADWLHKALETYRVPSKLVGRETAAGTIPRRLNPVFRDREELASATDLGRKVNEALAQSQNLIVICSPASATSHWVNEEVLAYKRMGRAERIFCLIVGGDPDASEMSARESEECFCPALRFRLDANGLPTHERTEPIAADARPGKDGKGNAKLKLIAGMLDVGFDQLKQREQQRRVRRMTAIAALALVVMAVTIVLSVFALISRHQAVIAQAAAERRQKQAEDLVDFMLGNLSDKLEAESRLDTMQDVDNKAMAYFDALPATDLNDTSLAQRAKALETIGYVRMATGDLPSALQAFRSSTRISSRLAAKAPADVSRQVAYAQTLSWIGMIHYQQGKLAIAQQDWQMAHRVLQPSVEQAPNDLALLQQTAYLDNNLDHVLAALGHPDQALTLAQERLELDDRLIRAKPSEADYIQDSGDAHNELGRLALQRGDLAAAIAEYRADDGIETRLSAQYPKDIVQRERMLKARAILSRTLALGGDVPTGLRDLQEAVAIARQLSGFDPQDTDARYQLALNSTQLARLLRQSGDLRAANTFNTNAVGIIAELVKKDSSNHSWQETYAAALNEQSAESFAAGDAAAARPSVLHALQILEPMLAKHPDERGTLLETMTAKLLLARLTEDPNQAQALREQVSRTMRAIKTDRDDPRLLALQVQALLAADRNSEAQPLIRKLWTSGYRDAEFVAMLKHQRIDFPVNATFQASLLSAHADDAVVRTAGKRQP